MSAEPALHPPLAGAGRRPGWRFLVAHPAHLIALGFGSGQVGVDRYVVQAAPTSGPHHRVDVLVVFHQDRDGIALAQTMPAKHVRQPIGPGLQFAESHHLTRLLQNDGGLVGVSLRVLADLHG